MGASSSSRTGKKQRSRFAAGNGSLSEGWVVSRSRLIDRVLRGVGDHDQRWRLDPAGNPVLPNIQLTSLEGGADEEKGVTISMEGTAAGREPRAVAEDFRQMLIEQVGKNRSEVKVEFKTLEDLDTAIAVSGANMPTAHFNLTVSFNPYPKKVEKAAPARKKREQQD